MDSCPGCLLSHCGRSSIITLQGLSRCQLHHFAFRRRILMRSVEVTLRRHPPIPCPTTSIQTLSLNPQQTGTSPERGSWKKGRSFKVQPYIWLEQTEIPVFLFRKSVAKQFRSCHLVNQPQTVTSCDWPPGIWAAQKQLDYSTYSKEEIFSPLILTMTWKTHYWKCDDVKMSLLVESYIVTF